MGGWGAWVYWATSWAREGRAKYIAQYGPLNSDDLTPEGGYAWLNDPWPWELGGND